MDCVNPTTDDRKVLGQIIVHDVALDVGRLDVREAYPAGTLVVLEARPEEFEVAKVVDDYGPNVLISVLNLHREVFMHPVAVPRGKVKGAIQ